MAELWTDAAAFPSVIFTFGLALSLVYWLLIILGALDLDVGHGEVDALHALKGVDALAAAKGIDADALHALKGVDADALHALKGVDALAAAKGVDALAGAKSAVPTGAGVAELLPEGMSLWLGLRQVPITVAASGVSLFGWVASMLGMRLLAPVVALGVPRPLASFLVFALAVAVALPLTSLATRPLRKLFQARSAKRRIDYVGSVCRIRTGQVDERFGQAEVADGGAGLIVEVRATPGTLKRGGSALIVDYDAEREAYLVEVFDEEEALRSREEASSDRNRS